MDAGEEGKLVEEKKVKISASNLQLTPYLRVKYYRCPACDCE